MRALNVACYLIKALNLLNSHSQQKPIGYIFVYATQSKPRVLTHIEVSKDTDKNQCFNV